MVYVCHKVGLLFPLCESCETFKECQREAKPSETHLDTMQIEQKVAATH